MREGEANGYFAHTAILKSCIRKSIAIGSSAGMNNQGDECIAIGAGTGFNNQPDETLIISADTGDIFPSGSGEAFA